MAGGPRNSSGSSSSKRKASPPKSASSSPSQAKNNGDSSVPAKRIKTARACDVCRRKKIRCNLDNKVPTGNPDNGLGGIVCAHCSQHGNDCTFFLPITETRFKKKREREAEAAAAAAAAQAPQGAQAAAMMARGSGNNLSGMSQQFGNVGSSSSMALPPIMNGAPGLSFPHPVPIETGPPGHISRTQEWPRRDLGHRWTTPWNSNSNHTIVSTPASAALRNSPQDQSDDAESSRSAAGRTPNSSRYSSMNSHLNPERGDSHSSTDTPQPPDSRVLGPTSIAYIVHSTAFVPGAAIEAHDLKHHQTFEVGTSGDGIIKFHKPPKGGPASSSGDEEETPRIPDSIRSRLAGDVAEKLVNSYFEKIATLFPVVTKSEFLHLSPPPPLLLYSICAVAALSREVPREVLGAVKMTLAGLFRENDLLSVSSNVTIRSLLIMSLHSDLHGSTAVQSGTRMWNRTGTAIRMAQDLGLHRDASGRDDADEDAFFLEQKRRIWGCCVTADRCTSISLGHPLAVDLTDCDVRLPSPYEILRYPTDPPSDPNAERPFAFNTEMLKISILFGRVMKTIYSPTGLMKATDEEITGLLSDMDRWYDNLPPELRFTGPDSPPPAGILYVMFASLQMLFFRVFMRISYVCPTHLSFSLTIERMTALIRYSRESIQWVDKHEFYLDTCQMVSYALVFCATTQYHAYVRRSDEAALESLRQCRDCVTRFRREGVEVQEELTLRAKTAEVISLLYEAASTASAAPLSTGHLNPTAGVTNRRTKETVSGLVFRADPTKPGGGVYVSTSRELVLRDLPKGTIILEETKTGRVPALMRTSDGTNGWQAVDAQGVALPAGAHSGQTPEENPREPSDPNERRPSTEGLTHLGAGVYIDASGKPISHRGSKLVTMVPLQPGQFSNLNQGLGGTDLASGSHPSVLSNGGDANPNEQRRFSFGLSGFNIGGSDPGMNVNPHLNDSAVWGQLDYTLGYPTIGTPNSSALQGGSAGGPSMGPNGPSQDMLLDGIPSGFDFEVWDSFFQRFQDPNQTGTSSGMMPGGGGEGMPLNQDPNLLPRQQQQPQPPQQMSQPSQLHQQSQHQVPTYLR